MSQERWDVVLRFLDGPLSYQEDVVSRGPVVRMGANPGPGGLVLDGYRGLDSVQATITAYNGAKVAITPMGTNQVRTATHQNVDWSEIQTITKMVYLTPGDVFHLGSPNRGVSVIFVECRRLGVWQQDDIASEAAQIDRIQPTNIRELDAQGGIPSWFIPAMLVTGMPTLAVMVVAFFAVGGGLIGGLGEEVDSIAYIEYVTEADLERIEQSDLDGFEQAFDAFVMAPNARAAGWDALREPSSWDSRFYRRTVAIGKLYQNRDFWRRLEEVHTDYAIVTQALRDAGLPTVFAAIPYQESRYRAEARSPVCALGIWQFMPETAHRYDLQVSGCKLKRSETLWSPTEKAPPGIRNSPYVDYYKDKNKNVCRIERCSVDERSNLQASTRAAVDMLRESWEHELTQSSGAGVQMSIMAHNMGFNDDKYLTGGRTKYGVLKAYLRHLKVKDKERSPHFYGDNITCNPETSDPHAANTMLEKCGGVLPNQSQQYVYPIIAQHLLAVCYYATNYGDDPAFSDWTEYTYGDGYCSQFSVPTSGSFRKDQ